jgi:hypothetical protein
MDLEVNPLPDSSTTETIDTTPYDVLPEAVSVSCAAVSVSSAAEGQGEHPESPPVPEAVSVSSAAEGQGEHPEGITPPPLCPLCRQDDRVEHESGKDHLGLGRKLIRPMDSNNPAEWWCGRCQTWLSAIPENVLTAPPAA